MVSIKETCEADKATRAFFRLTNFLEGDRSNTRWDCIRPRKRGRGGAIVATMTATRHRQKAVHGWSSKNLDRAKLVSSRSVRTKGEAGRVNAGETSDIKP